jgi:hypothetical protein
MGNIAFLDTFRMRGRTSTLEGISWAIVPKTEEFSCRGDSYAL